MGRVLMKAAELELVEKKIKKEQREMKRKGIKYSPLEQALSKYL